MEQSSPQTLTVEIIEVLESCGVDRDQYQLHDYIDAEALEQLIAGSSGQVEVRVTVEGIRLAVTENGVEITNSEGGHIGDQYDVVRGISTSRLSDCGRGWCETLNHVRSSITQIMKLEPAIIFR